MSRRTPESPLPFTKVCDLAGDAEQLTSFYYAVDSHPEALAGQHAIRRWEYAMARYTIHHWDLHLQSQLVAAGHLTPPPALEICDVGGAGSNFWQVLTDLTASPIMLVDPHVQRPEMVVGQSVAYPLSIEEFAATHAHGQFDILTCISVIEHVEEIRRFFRACHMVLKPGGLLFLTTDFWDAEGPDTAHFHWMRQRIYNVERAKRLLEDVRALGFRSLGQADWAYPGPQVYDYSVCSLALIKKA